MLFSGHIHRKHQKGRKNILYHLLRTFSAASVEIHLYYKLTCPEDLKTKDYQRRQLFKCRAQIHHTTLQNIFAHVFLAMQGKHTIFHPILVSVLLILSALN